MPSLRRGRRAWPASIAAVILLAQVGAVAYVHISGTNERYFAWAPNDYSVVYTISTSVHGHALTPDQVAARYGIPEHGLWEYPPQQLVDILNRYETTYGSGQHAAVTLRYSLDGHPELTWRRT
jgi:hypothetical protein